MSDILEKARAKRDRLVTEVTRLDAFIAMATELAGEDAAQDRPAAPNRTENTTQRKPSDTVVRTYSVARQALQDRGAPIGLGELLRIVIDEGVEVGGRKPAATLSARLSNCNEFKSYRGLGWWLSDRPLPDGGRQVSLMNEAGEAPAKEPSPASDASHERNEDAPSVA